MNWYALHVASNHERKVQEQLQFQEFQELTPFWIPDSKRISRFTKKPIERALFPGYVFARFDAACYTPILRIPGVIQVLTVERAPAIITESEIENIRRLVACPSLLRPVQATPNVQPGDWVEVIHGPLTGLQGQVTYLETRMRVVIWVQTLHSGVSAEVTAGDLMRIRKAA
jgi:transcription termination/antitermination protein NusG